MRVGIDGLLTDQVSRNLHKFGSQAMHVHSMTYSYNTLKLILKHGL